MEMTGIGSIKTHTLFLVGNHGDCKPSLSDVGIETPSFLTRTITRAQP